MVGVYPYRHRLATSTHGVAAGYFSRVSMDCMSNEVNAYNISRCSHLSRPFLQFCAKFPSNGCVRAAVIEIPSMRIE